MVSIVKRTLLVAFLASTASLSQAQDPKRVDDDGKPLQERALCRLGSSRFLHPRVVSCATFSADGKLFASGSVYGDVIVREWPNGKALRTLEAPLSIAIADACDSMRFSPDAKFLAIRSGSTSQEKTRLDQDGAPLPERAVCRLGSNRFLHPSFVTRTAYSADGKRIASVDRDGKVLISEWPTGKLLQKREVPFSTVIISGCDAMRFSTDGNHLAICNGEVHFLHLADGKVYSKGKSSSLPTFSPKSSQVAWIEPPSTVCVMDRPDSDKVRRLPRKQTVKALVHDKAGHLLGVEVQDQAIALVNLTQDRVIHRWVVGDSEVEWAEFTPDAQRLAVYTSDRDMRVFDVAEKKLCFPASKIPDKHKVQALRPDGKALVLYSPNTTLLWSLEDSKRIAPLHGGRQDTAAFSPLGDLIAIGAGRAAGFWDAKTGKLLDFYAGHLYGIGCIAFSPDGTEVATSGSGQQIRFWDASTGSAKRKTDKIPTNGTLAYTPDGKHLVATGYAPISDRWAGPALGIWKASTLELEHRLEGHRYGAGSVAVSGDSKLLCTVASGGPKNVIIWDLDTGKPRAEHKDLGAGGRYVSFLPNGRTIVLGNFDRIRIWNWHCNLERACEIRASGMALSSDGLSIAVTGRFGLKLIEVRSGKEIWHSPAGKEEPPTGTVAFASDGRTIAGSKGDGTVQLFNWATDKQVSFKGATRGPHHLTFSPDGRRLAGVENHTALIWDVADLVHRPLVKPDNVTPEQIDAWCARLSSPDGKSAYQAVWKLVAVGDASVPKLKARLAPVSASTAKKIANWILDLDSKQFGIRNKAERELLNAGEDALLAIEAAQKKPRSLEQSRRLQEIGKSIKEGQVTPQTLLEMRSIMALEQIDTASACDVLAWLCQGDAAGSLTEHARLALGRLNKKKATAQVVD